MPRWKNNQTIEVTNQRIKICRTKDLVILDTQGINPPLDKEAIELMEWNAYVK